MCSKGDAAAVSPGESCRAIEVPQVEDCLQPVVNIIPLQVCFLQFFSIFTFYLFLQSEIRFYRLISTDVIDLNPNHLCEGSNYKHLGPFGLRGEEGGSGLELAKNRLILSQIYFTLLYFLSLSLNSNGLLDISS